jgi:hypothetical protein
MLNHAFNPAIQAQAANPVLTLANPVHNSPTDLQQVCNLWGFYPVTRPLGLFKKAPVLPFKMKAGETSKGSTFFITMLNTVKMRRNILLTLDCAKPIGAFDRLILSVIQAEHPNTTKEELCGELDYLAGRDLIEIECRQDGRWFCELRGGTL